MIATGRGAFFLLPWVFRALVAGQRADHDVDAATDELRGKVGMAEGFQLRDKFLDHLKPNVGVRHLPPAKAQGHFHFHVLAQKINRVADLDAEVMGVNAGTELDFLDGGGVLMFLGLLVLLGLFVAKLAEVHDPADGRHGVGGNLDEIHGALAREVDGVVQRHHAELIAVNADNAHFAGANFPIDPNERDGGITAWRERATQGTLIGCKIIVSFGFKLAGIASGINRDELSIWTG